jgi:hypothetical protein
MLIPFERLFVGLECACWTRKHCPLFMGHLVFFVIVVPLFVESLRISLGWQNAVETRAAP